MAACQAATAGFPSLGPIPRAYPRHISLILILSLAAIPSPRPSASSRKAALRRLGSSTCYVPRAIRSLTMMSWATESTAPGVKYFLSDGQASFRGDTLINGRVGSMSVAI